MSFYGDLMRWWYGVVEEVGTDEPRLGRVRVRIYGVHAPEIPVADLPFASCVIPTTEHGGSGIGFHPNLGEGSTVCGFFLDGGNSQQPIIWGSIPSIEVPSQVQVDNVNQNFVVGAIEANPVRPDTGQVFAYHGNFDPILKGDNIQIAWEFFTRLQSAEPGSTKSKYTHKQVAAIIGNLLEESNMDPAAVGDSKTSFGIAQWHITKNKNNRYQQLINFGQDKGGWEKLIVQLAFIDYELDEVSYHKGARFRATTTIEDATVTFQRYYEIPALTGNKSAWDGAPERIAEAERIQHALDVYNSFTRVNQ